MTTAPAPPGTIVVGVDDSPASDRALSWAAEQARAQHCGITVLHAMKRLTPTFATDPGLEHPTAPGSLRSGGRQVTGRAVRTLRAAGFEGPAHERPVPASAVDALVEASVDAELVVVGARRPGPLGTFLLGSVRRALVGRSHCPVVVVPEPSSPEEGRGVLVAVDDREPGHAALDFAYRQAERRAVNVTVLGCLLTPAGVFAGAAELDPDDPEAERQHRYLREVTAGFATQTPDVVTRIEVDRGPVDEAVVRASRNHELVVLGSRTHSWLSRLLTRDIDRWVVSHAPCPVAVVPERNADEVDR